MEKASRARKKAQSHVLKEINRIRKAYKKSSRELERQYKEQKRAFAKRLQELAAGVGKQEEE